MVLGAPLAPGGALSAVVDERVCAGVELWHRGGAPILVVTGGGPPGRVEADAMARRALELGVPQHALLVEREATSTADNARLVAAMLQERSCRSVWIVSQPFHLRRAALLFHRHGLEPLGWHADDSVQFRHPRAALRWIAREYAALAQLAVFRAAAVVRGSPGR